MKDIVYAVEIEGAGFYGAKQPNYFYRDSSFTGDETKAAVWKSRKTAEGYGARLQSSFDNKPRYRVVTIERVSTTNPDEWVEYEAPVYPGEPGYVPPEKDPPITLKSLMKEPADA